MISINRKDCPNCLTDTPKDGDKYNKKEVVLALWNMQYGKCCYSEKYLAKKGHDKAVDHFQPKSIFKFLKNQWTNLLLACSHCNGRKSNKFPIILANDDDEDKFETVIYIELPSNGTPAILDPSDPDVDPEIHLTYILDDVNELYGQITPRNNSIYGKITIDVTGIDDDIFFRERNEMLNTNLQISYLNILKAKTAVDNGADESLLNTQLNDFKIKMDSSQQYAGLAREFARNKELDERFAINVPGPDINE